MNDHLTTAAAGAAVVSPWWLHALSDTAALLLPILGAAWLLTQIATKLLDVWKKNRAR